MKNRDKLYKLYAKVTGSLYHVRFHGYDYVNQNTGKKERRYLQDFDIVLYGYLKLNSDMRNPYKNDGKGHGTGMTHWFSIKMLSDSSRRVPVDVDPNNKTNPPAWSTSKIQRSLKRLTESGFLQEKINTNATRKAKLNDPIVMPSKQDIAEEEIIASKWKERKFV